MPAPRTSPPLQQTAVAVAPPPPAGFSPYGLPDYSRQLPYPPVMGTPMRRRRSGPRKLFIGLAVGVLALVVAGGVLEEQDRNATANAVQHTSIQLPDQAAGLTKITGKLADQLSALDASQPGLAYVTHLTGGYQLANGKPRVVVVVGKFAVESHDMNAAIASEEAGAHKEETSMGIPLTTFQQVDAGPLGGKMVCGEIEYPQVNGTECMFVDRATAGSLTMLDVDGSDDHALALQLRGAIETRT